MLNTSREEKTQHCSAEYAGGKDKYERVYPGQRCPDL